MTLEQLTTLVTTLSGQIDLLPTQEDITVLLNSISNQHQALLSAITDLDSRLALLEEAHLNHSTNDTRHN